VDGATTITYGGAGAGGTSPAGGASNGQAGTGATILTLP
jgi:hypothetical protein